jgi:4-amino-4-deoxy-L-arabinose transferase-like glycosyltransferase
VVIGDEGTVSRESRDVVDEHRVPRVIGATRVRAGLFVSLIATLLVFPPLGQRLIATGGYNGDDEARYPLLARDMLRRSVWFDLQVRGERSWEKPPLYPWAIAAFSRVRGRVTEATARAPVALAAVGTVLFTFLLGDRLFNRRAGLWAGLILVTSYDFFGNSQLVLPDMLVVGFATVAAWAFWLAVSEPSERGALVTFYAAVAFAVFAKGPLGLLPLLGAAIWLWTEYGLKGFGRLWRPAGVGLFALITLAWLGPFLALGVRSFAEHTVWGDWLTWYFGRPPRSAGELVYMVMVGFLPWTVLTPLAMASACRAWRSPAVRFALLWFAIPLLVLMLSAHYKPRYSLSMYPGAALLVAWWADAHGTARSIRGRVIGWLALGSAAATIVALRVPQWWHPQTRVYITGLSWWEFLPVVAGLALIGGAIFWGLRLGRPALLVHGVATAMVVILGYGIWAYNRRYNEAWNFKELVARVEQYARGGDAAVFRHRPDWLSIDFYLQRPPRSISGVEELNEYLARDDRPVVVMDDRTWRTVERGLSPEVRVLEQMTIGREKMLIVSGGPEYPIIGEPN